MRRIWIFLCCILLVSGMSLTAYAEEITLDTSIPYCHTVSISSPSGRIVVDGTVAASSVDVARHREQEYLIIADYGKIIDKVIYDGEDVTDQVQNGIYTAPKLVRDAEIKVIYKDAPSAPDDNKYTVGGTVVDEDGNPIPGVKIEIAGKTDETDDDGKFKIEDIPSGTYPVVITDPDGDVIGYTPITIEESDNTDLILTVDEEGNPVIKPADSTEQIEGTFIVTDDGNIRIENVKDITLKPSAPNAPQTGDTSNLWLWWLLLITSATALTVLLADRRRRQNKPM